MTWAKFQQGFGCFGEASDQTADTRDTWASKDINISEKINICIIQSIYQIVTQPPARAILNKFSIYDQDHAICRE